MKIEDISIIPKYELSSLQKSGYHNTKIISFNAVIQEGAFKGTKIYFYHNQRTGQRDFRVTYTKIMHNGVEVFKDTCETALNKISSNIILQHLHLLVQ